MRYVFHVDMDAFFASIEQLANPRLRGQPVIVGGTSNRGVVAAASYEVRKFGVRSAMPIREALRRCPHAICVKPRMSVYRDVSHQVFAVFHEYTPIVEGLSLDEAFLDVTASRALFGDGATIARRIRGEVEQEERITVSIGVAPSKFVAKIASDVGKPDGLVVVAPADVATFLRDLPVQRLWGAGPKSLRGFQRLDTATIGAVAALPVDRLVEVFGDSLGPHFHALANGRDPRPVVPSHQRKSIGHESTFAEDVHDRGRVEATLMELVDQVARRLRRAGAMGQTVHLKLRTADFHTVSRQVQLAAPADTSDAIWPAARELFVKADQTRQAIRLIGVSLSVFDGERQLTLFSSRDDRHRRVAHAVDQLTDKFGPEVVKRGSVRDRKA
jgi:DNA polymerase IV